MIFIKKYIFFIIILLLTGCFNKKIDYLDKVSIKIGDEVPSVKSYVKNYEDLKGVKDIVWKGIVIEDNKVYYSGIYEGTFKYGNKDFSVILNIIDDIKPEIVNVKDITITVGEKVDLLKDIKVSDNSKDSINTEIIGDYDVNKVGTYILNVSATDASNNSNSIPFKLVVKEKQNTEIINNDSLKNENLSGTTTKGYNIIKENEAYYIKGILVANKTYALSSTYNPGGLTNEFLSAFNKMKADALSEGITLWIQSGYRSYDFQNTLYSQYVNSYGKEAADTFSARPGHSEHQTGLGADFNEISESFGNTKAGIWLSNNCYKYGFILRYPKGKESVTGYIYEPWHFRYIGSEAKNLYNNGDWITLEEYLGIDSKYS